MKPHQDLVAPAPPVIHPDSALSAATFCRDSLPLSEASGAVIYHVVYTDRNLAIFTDRGISSFGIDSDGELWPRRFHYEDYPLEALLDAGRVAQQSLIDHQAKVLQEQAQLDRDSKLRLYFRLKEAYEQGELCDSPAPQGT